MGTLVSAAVVVLAAEVAFSHAEGQPLRPAIRDLKVSDIFVPKDLGYVAQTHELPNPGPSTKLLLLIQDAHADLDAQKHLAALLDRFARDYGLRLVLVEGGEGDVDLSYLRTRGSKAAREAVATRYLEEGLLSGEEYLQITSAHPLRLWGVEDLALYDAHVAAFLDAQQVRALVSPALATLRRAVEQVRARITSDVGHALDAQTAKFRAKELSLGEYLRQLAGAGERAGVPLSSFPALDTFLKAAETEDTLDLEQVKVQQREALSRLQAVAPATEVARLKRISQEQQAGRAAVETFYLALDDLLRRFEIDRAPFPALAAYLDYVRRKAALTPKALLEELAAAETQIKNRLAASPDEAALADIAEGLALYERLLALQWSPDDERAFQAKRAAWRLSAWVPVVQAQAAAHGMPLAWDAHAAELDAQVDQAARFYDLLDGRDDAMVAHALAKMDAERASLAVLIAGGYHTDGLSRRFLQHGVQVAVITPLVGEASDESRYARILRTKHERRLTPMAHPE